jgi:hypothetical protein
VVLAAREEEFWSEVVAEGWVVAGRSVSVWEKDGWRRVCLLTEGIWHAEGVAVCFDEVAAFDVGFEIEMGN